MINFVPGKSRIVSIEVGKIGRMTSIREKP
jgi:hypothetical protein